MSVRSMTNHKYGLDIAIRAWVGFESPRLTIVGQGRLEPWLRALALRLGSPVSFHTDNVSHSEMADLYREYDFFVAPSRLEGQGLAMCEAMAAGLPVVASPVGGIPEIVRNGVDRILARAVSTREVRDAVVRIVSDERKFTAMGESAADRSGTSATRRRSARRS